MKLAGSLLAALVASTNGDHVDHVLDELKDGCVNVVQYVPLRPQQRTNIIRKASVEDINFSFELY